MTEPPWLGDDATVTAWRAGVDDWVRAQARVIEITTVRARPWGIVLRVETDGAPVFFKAAGPHGRNEPMLLADLADWHGLVPDVLAIDHDRAWMLMADHGNPMSDILDASERVDVVERLLPPYARMQQATADLVPRWVDAGVPDRRVERVPMLVDELLAGATPAGALPMTDGERRACADASTDLAHACAALASTTVPAAIDHADLHGTNVLVADGDARLVDWGDACVTHPFCSVFVPFELVVPALPEPERRSATLRLRDAYLSSWSGGATSALHEPFALATWVAGVCRALNVASGTAGATPDQRVVDHEEITGLLRSWLAKRALLDRFDDVLL